MLDEVFPSWRNYAKAVNKQHYCLYDDEDSKDYSRHRPSVRVSAAVAFHVACEESVDSSQAAAAAGEAILRTRRLLHIVRLSAGQDPDNQYAWPELYWRRCHGELFAEEAVFDGKCRAVHIRFLRTYMNEQARDMIAYYRDASTQSRYGGPEIRSNLANVLCMLLSFYIRCAEIADAPLIGELMTCVAGDKELHVGNGEFDEASLYEHVVLSVFSSLPRIVDDKDEQLRRLCRANDVVVGAMLAHSSDRDIDVVNIMLQSKSGMRALSGYLQRNHVSVLSCATSVLMLRLPFYYVFDGDVRALIRSAAARKPFFVGDTTTSYCDLSSRWRNTVCDSAFWTFVCDCTEQTDTICSFMHLYATLPFAVQCRMASILQTFFRRRTDALWRLQLWSLYVDLVQAGYDGTVASSMSIFEERYASLLLQHHLPEEHVSCYVNEYALAWNFAILRYYGYHDMVTRLFHRYTNRAYVFVNFAAEFYHSYAMQRSLLLGEWSYLLSKRDTMPKLPGADHMAVPCFVSLVVCACTNSWSRSNRRVLFDIIRREASRVSDYNHYANTMLIRVLGANTVERMLEIAELLYDSPLATRVHFPADSIMRTFSRPLIQQTLRADQLVTMLTSREQRSAHDIACLAPFNYDFTCIIVELAEQQQQQQQQCGATATMPAHGWSYLYKIVVLVCDILFQPYNIRANGRHVHVVRVIESMASAAASFLPIAVQKHMALLVYWMLARASEDTAPHTVANWVRYVDDVFNSRHSVRALLPRRKTTPNYGTFFGLPVYERTWDDLTTNFLILPSGICVADV